MGEYRINELAQAAGISVRTVRYYRERRLLPPPRRAGRVALYSSDHLGRLRVIARLLERGHTLDTVAELIAAWEQGLGVADLMGLDRAATENVPCTGGDDAVSMTSAELAGLFGGNVTAEESAQAVALGYVRIEGETVRHASRRLLPATASLVRAGIPLQAVLAAAARLRRALDELSDQLVDHVVTHSLERPLPPDHPGPEPTGLGHEPGGPGPDRGPGGTPDAAVGVRSAGPVRFDIDAEFGRALDRRVRRLINEVLSDLVGDRNHRAN